MKLEIKENIRSLCFGPNNFVYLRQEEMILTAPYGPSRIYESCIIQKSSWTVHWLSVSRYETDGAVCRRPLPVILPTKCRMEGDTRLRR